MVFLGFQRKLRRRVAVKILPKTAEISDDDGRMFHDEAIVVAGFSHPNIVPVFEMGETEDCFYQIMQIVNGSNLETVIENQRKNPLPYKRSVPIRKSIALTLGVLDGLAYAHTREVVHLDMKPGNILIEEHSNRPLITDFGIAKTAQSKKTSRYIVGSPLYLAPERLNRQHVDCRADIYSVGLVLYELAAGTLPLATREATEVLRRKVNDPSSLFCMPPAEASPQIDTLLERIILKAISAEPDLRYRDCREFMHALKEYRRTLE